MSLWMMHWRLFAFSSFLHILRVAWWRVACLFSVWNKPEKGWIPSWTRVPWRMGKKIFVVYVYHVWTISHEQAGVWIPTTTIFTFTEYYLVLHTTWMAWFQRRKATSLELSTTYQSPAISWLQKSLTAISIQLTLLTRLSRHTGPRLVSTICTLYDHQQLTRQENRWNAETPKNLISWRAYTDMEYMEHTWSILVEDITRTP